MKNEEELTMEWDNPREGTIVRKEEADLPDPNGKIRGTMKKEIKVNITAKELEETIAQSQERIGANVKKLTEFANQLKGLGDIPKMSEKVQKLKSLMIKIQKIEQSKELEVKIKNLEQLIDGEKKAIQKRQALLDDPNRPKE